MNAYGRDISLPYNTHAILRALDTREELAS